jgi:acetyl esterase/lipase
VAAFFTPPLLPLFMKKITFLLLLMVTCWSSLQAQMRYLDQVFTQTSVSSTVYGNNHSVITLSQIGHTFPIPQRVDIYRPKDDTATNRPLIIYLQTGNFLPLSINGTCTGTITDSSNVELATRLAKMGYVVAVTSYRQGWRPDLPVQLLIHYTWINALYRGMQDVRSCIRFFRKSVAEGGNPYGIDPNKVVVWGQGTGGFVSLAAAYLNNYEELLTTSDSLKYMLPTSSGNVSMVNPIYHGDINGFPPAGQTVCKVDAAYAASTGFPLGDTLCTSQNAGYASNFNLCVNMGGALADSTWLDAGEMPLISYHVPTDYFAPCQTKDFYLGPAICFKILPITTGSCDLHDIIEQNGNNSIFESVPASSDPYKVAGYSGFRPFNGTPNNFNAPWEWRPGPNPTPPNILSLCNNDAVSSRKYIDTIVGYFAPRACVALDLCSFSKINEINSAEIGLSVAPVPAVDAILFQTTEEPIRSIYIYDLNGRLVKAHTNIDNNVFRMERNSLANGLYIAELKFDRGFAKRRIVFTSN